jgi:uncharacterized membrane protein YqjE
MPAPEGTGPAQNPSLFASLRSFWSVLLAILYTRLDLVTAELEDEAIRAVKVLLAGAIAFVSFSMAFFFAMFFVIAATWNGPYRLWVIGGIFFIYLLIGFIGVLAARNMIFSRPRFLSQTIAELRRDVEGLNRSIASKKDES